jgi:signal transduction histidine kinase
VPITDIEGESDRHTPEFRQVTASRQAGTLHFSVVGDGDGLAMERSQMRRPMTSTQWLARLASIVAIAASEVVLPAAFGLGALRVAGLAASAAVFLAAYLVTALPGKAADGAARAVIAMCGSGLVAAALTGGLLSPLLPMLAVPIALAWTTYRPRHAIVIGLGSIAGLLALLVPVTPGALLFDGRELAVLASWSLIIATWAIGRRVEQLQQLQHTQAACLARIREGALLDAASRRRGLESMTTKLAHELKNPLAAIKSLVQVERSRAADDKSQRRLDVALGEVERIGAILREYLDLARPVEVPHVTPVSLDDLMAEVSALLSGRAEAAAVNLTVEGSGGAIHADARLLKEAVVNVVNNAIEATPRGGAVDVTYHVGRDRTHITVRDTGRGMTRDVVARIGTPFFTTRDGGTGLGVVIARTAIAQHHGTLEFSSIPGVGTTATIALPQKRASA